nr:small VCP/p97-interacting protein [Vulpes vulpes]
MSPSCAVGWGPPQLKQTPGPILIPRTPRCIPSSAHGCAHLQPPGCIHLRPLTKRAKLAEAAERRQKEAASRGILDVRSVEEKRKKKEKIEKQMAESGPPPEGGLRWTVS